MYLRHTRGAFCLTTRLSLSEFQQVSEAGRHLKVIHNRISVPQDAVGLKAELDHAKVRLVYAH
jgi:hypothetical protein